MSRGGPSGYSLDKDSARIAIGMANRGDRNHDIAAWFGVNQGRIAEAKEGKYGTVEAAPAHELPPKGPPGIKGRRIRGASEKALSALDGGDSDAAAKILRDAINNYDANET